MFRILAVLLLPLAVAACASSPAASPRASSTSAKPAPSTIARVSTPLAKATSVAVIRPVKPTSSYLSFLTSICHALGSHDASTVENALMNYQYNTGVRYGNLGDGEGQTADSSILSSWLASTVVRCRFYTSDVAGHATVLTSGWTMSAGWSLIEMDVVNGSWKINDFTFGTSSALYRAMQTSHPILTYRA